VWLSRGAAQAVLAFCVISSAVFWVMYGGFHACCECGRRPAFHGHESVSARAAKFCFYAPSLCAKARAVRGAEAEEAAFIMAEGQSSSLCAVVFLEDVPQIVLTGVVSSKLGSFSPAAIVSLALSCVSVVYKFCTGMSLHALAANVATPQPRQPAATEPASEPPQPPQQPQLAFEMQQPSLPPV
jgi:hypothetical protein